MRNLTRISCLTLTALCVASNLVAQTTISNGLVAYFQFDGNANDALANSSTLSVVGVTYTSNRFGTQTAAAQFSVNGYVAVGIPSISSIESNSEFSVSAWLSYDASFFPIFEKYNSADDGGWGFYRSYADLHYPQTDGDISTSAGSSGWHQYVLTVSKSNSLAAIYVDGLRSSTLTSNVFLKNTNPNDAAYIGYSPAGSDEYARGALDDLRIYNRALPSNEVAQLYGIESATVCTPHKATGTTTLVNGFVVGATITDPGCGYSNAPTVLILGGGGTGATATCSVNNGKVNSVTITGAGCCYTNAPQIVFASPPFVPTVAIGISKVKVTQHVQLGLNYVLESSSNLVDWVATGPQYTAQDEFVVNEFDVSPATRFFRIRQVP